MLQNWFETKQFRHVVKYIKHMPQDEYPTLLFRGTVKLHGTNVGITREQGEYHCQSRKHFITPNQDLYGVASWFNEIIQDETIRQQFDIMFDTLMTDPDDIITIYGEWVGPNIQSNVAVNNLSEKMWFIFGARVNGNMKSNSLNLTVPSYERIRNILEFPVFFQSVNFNDDLTEVLEQLQRLTLSIEDQCPVGQSLGLKGTGEGIVWTCMEFPENSNLMFKTKGEKHCGKKNTKKKVATVSPEIMTKIEDVVNYVVTDGRLQQCLQNIPELDMKHIGCYIKLVCQDIIKEESDTIEANNLTWKDINKHVISKVRNFFIKELDKHILTK